VRDGALLLLLIVEAERGEADTRSGEEEEVLGRRRRGEWRGPLGQRPDPHRRPGAAEAACRSGSGAVGPSAQSTFFFASVPGAC
jgi:hypothetical protein